jgi:hypothetical protein
MLISVSGCLRPSACQFCYRRPSRTPYGCLLNQLDVNRMNVAKRRFKTWIRNPTRAADQDLADDLADRARPDPRWEAAPTGPAAAHDPPERSVAMALMALKSPKGWFSLTGWRRQVCAKIGTLQSRRAAKEGFRETAQLRKPTPRRPNPHSRNTGPP